MKVNKKLYIDINDLDQEYNKLIDLDNINKEIGKGIILRDIIIDENLGSVRFYSVDFEFNCSKSEFNKWFKNFKLKGNHGRNH